MFYHVFRTEVILLRTSREEFYRRRHCWSSTKIQSRSAFYLRSSSLNSGRAAEYRYMQRFFSAPEGPDPGQGVILWPKRVFCI